MGHLPPGAAPHDGVSAASWIVDQWVGSAATLPARPLLSDGRRRISQLTVRGPAIVLGSTTPEVEPPGGLSWGGESVEFARRRSGGGLVWLHPDESTWIDVFVPRGDPLHDDDVGRSFGWLGSALADAFASFGVAAVVYSGLHDPGSGGGFVCFEGRGPGEVLVGEKKLVGISQRRTRAGSRFQCVWYRRWQLGALRSLVDPDSIDDLAHVGVGTDDLGLSGTSGEVLATVVRAISELSA